MRSFVLCIVVSVLSCTHGAFKSFSGQIRYLPDKEYVYQFESNSTLAHNIEMNLNSEIKLYLLSEAKDWQDLHVTIGPPVVNWYTSTGQVTDRDTFSKDKEWFTIRQNDDGTVLSVSYQREPSDRHSLIAIRKSIAQILSINRENMDSLERKPLTSGESIEQVYTLEEGGFKKRGRKVSIVSQNREIIEVDLVEDILTLDGTASGLMNAEMSSHSRLLLQKTVELSAPLQDINEYQNVVTEPPTIETPGPTSIDVSSIQSRISDLLSCARNELTCKEDIVTTLRALSIDDISSLAASIFKHVEWSPLNTRKALTFIDVLVKSSSSGSTTDVLVDNVLVHKVPSDLVRRVLFYLTTSLVPTEKSVSKAMAYINSDQTEEDLREKALLSLGSMSRFIRDSNPALSSNITLYLHNMLERYIEETSQPECSLMTIINSISNAADNSSIDIVRSHAMGQDTSHNLKVQLAAIRALSRYSSTDAADTLEDIAQMSSHPQVQHASASAYMKHPNASKDLSHLLKRSSREVRSRRNIESEADESIQQYNVTMPSVNWGLSFGDDNITTSMARNVLNSFDIINDPFSTEYIFSIRDEATFSSSLSLSSGKQHNNFLQTEFCLEGSVTYDANMETNYHHLLITEQFNELQSVIDSITVQFQSAYKSMKGSEALYSTLTSDLDSAIDSAFDQLQLTSQYLNQFLTSSQDILTGNALKQDTLSAASTINATYKIVQEGLENSRQEVEDTLGSFLPSKLDAFFTLLLKENQPFTLQSDLVPYFEYAPQTALAGIYNIYWKSGTALNDLEQSIDNFSTLTSKYGHNSNWTNPYLSVWSVEDDIDELLISIELEKENAIDDGRDTLELQSLTEMITVDLKPALYTLINAIDDVHSTVDDLHNALENTQNGYNEFTKGYESARSTVDSIFGQRFYPGFPSTLRSCDPSCGTYPSTSENRFRNGIDLIQTSDQSIPAPFAGYVSLFDLSSLSNPSAYNYSTNNTLVLTPTEFSMDSMYFVISNIDPDSAITSSQVFVSAGETIGTSMQLLNSYGIHVEAYKTIDGVTYSINPTQFVAPVLKPEVNFALDCNELTTIVNGMVVSTQEIISSDPVKKYIGEPLVTIDINDEEFPDPYDLVLQHGIDTRPAEDVEFFQSSTFLMVGVVPVTFKFSSYGRYDFNMSLYAGLLSRTADINITPKVWGRVEGSMKVGDAIFATVVIDGMLLNASLPLNIKQDHSQWPLSASSTMDLVLYPSSLNLTTQLIQRVGVGELATENVLETDVPWAYDIPDVNIKNEFHYTGIHSDSTPPTFSSLSYANHSNCNIRQLMNRDYTNPAFEIEFSLQEPEGLSDVQLMIGTHEDGEDVLSATVLRGERLILPNSLSLKDELIATVSATNRNGLESSVHCVLSDYDLSPPQARVVPFSYTTSHPNMFQVLLVLFDEYGLTEDMELGVGSVAGNEGHDLLNWVPLKTDRINQVIENEKFSFPRAGRLIENVISVTTDIDDNDCSVMCEGHTDCLSYDYSDNQKRCILHSSIVGPLDEDSFVNTFATLPLQVSQDFVHYEVLGKGYATMYTITDLKLEHGQEFNINLKLQNKLGFTNVVSSPSILVDLTPPTPGRVRNTQEDTELVECGEMFNVEHLCRGETTTINNHRIIYDGNGSDVVFNGATPLYDALYTRANNFIAANWEGIEDRESGLLAYTWCISSSTEYTCDIFQQQNPHGSVTEPAYWTNTGLARFSTLLHDGPYYITVDAINGVGYGGALITTIHHTTPYILDTTPPVTEYLTITEYDSVQNVLTVDFSVKDTGSGVKDVSISLGTTVDNTDILPWTGIITESYQDVSASVSVVIPDGVSGWVKIRAINNVDLETFTTSTIPIIVDRSPPTSGTLNDGSTKGTDINYQSDQTQICANWEGVSDPHSGVSSYQWAVGTSPGMYDTVPLQNVTDFEATKRLVSESVALTHDATYYSTLIVVNGADEPLTTILLSNGVKVDVTPPSSGNVADGSSSDIQYSHSLTTLSATWNGFSDEQSGIDHYTVTVYRKPQDSLDFVSVLANQSVIASSYFGNHFNFANGDEVKVEITAFNEAGLTATASSNGYTIDLTSPEVTVLHDGLDSSIDHDYLSDSSSYSVNWAAFDPESGLDIIEIALFRLSEGKKTRVFPDPLLIETTEILDDPLLTSYTIENLQLTHDYKYIAVLSFTNKAGLKSSFETNGATIDVKAPVMESVSVLGDTYLDEIELMSAMMIGSNKQVEVSWEGSDDGSGITEFALTVIDNEDNVVPSDDVVYTGDAKSGRISGLLLAVGDQDNGPFYRVRVIATDKAGHESSPVYSTSFWVSENDYAGIVYDGYSAFDDVDYTDELSSISTYFNGFFSTQCGGVREYQWAVGHGSDNKSSVLPYTTNGMVVVGNGSGYAQLLLPELNKIQSEELFITVRGITGCGDILESTSNGFVFDASPPAIDILQTGQKAVENITSDSIYQNEQTFSSTWTVSEDSGEAISHVTATVGSYPGGDDLMNATQVVADHIRVDITAPEGVASYITVTATNKAGLVGSQYSAPVVMDTSLPEVNYIDCSHSNDLQNQLKCSWNVIDAESGIDYFLLSLATDQSDKNRINTTIVPSFYCSAAFNVMNYSSDQSYYVTLYAYNHVGLENIITSDPIYFDTSPPVSEGSIFVLPNYGDNSYQNSEINITSEASCVLYTNILSLRFSQSNDEETGIKEYNLGIGNIPGGDDILAFHKIAVELSDWVTYMLHLADDVLNRESRSPYYFTVRAINNAGLYSDITSAAIYVKSEDNALTSWVMDGNVGQNDRDYQHSGTEAGGRVFFGVNCPMRKVEWSIQGVDGIIVKNFTDIDLIEAQYADNSYSFSTDQVMYDNETYRLIVRGIDYSEQVHVIKSDGITITKRPLIPGFVVEGLDGLLELNYQESLTSLTINYDGFGDGTEEQEIEYYEVALGSDSEYSHTKSDIVPFTNVGLDKTHSFSGIDLVPLTQTYYATVRAHAVSGAVAEVTSNGIVVGLTHSITPGTIYQTPYQTNSTFISAHWSGFESEVPITKYEWALGTRAFSHSYLQSLCVDRTNLHESEFEVFGFQNLNKDTYAIASDVNLEHGLKYYVTLRVTDQSDMCIVVSSHTPTVIDKTAPVVNNVTIGPVESRINTDSVYIAYLIDGNSLSVSWEDFLDMESGIETYEVGFFKLASCIQGSFATDKAIIEYVDVGVTNEFTFENLHLDFNVSYAAKIRATNHAGLKAVAISNPVLLDTFNLEAGEVKDGNDWEKDLVFQSDLTKLSGAVALSYFPPQNILETPCPSDLQYSFNIPHSEWSSKPFVDFSGLKSSSLRYESGIVDYSTDNGTSINAYLDPTKKQLVSGAYHTPLIALVGRKTISMNVRLAIGDARLQQHTVTSILILETSNDDLLVEYDPTVTPESTSVYKALGLQIHTQGSTTDEQQLVLWYKDDSELSTVKIVSHNVALNITEFHRLRFEFFYEENGLATSTKVEVYINDILRLALHDIPHFTSNANLVFHMFNREGYLPECTGICAQNSPRITALFSDVSLPASDSNGACSYGSPFYSWGSPIVELKAGIGTSTDATDIKPLEVVYSPCRPCIQTPCHLYSCDQTCPTSDDPETVMFSFVHLSLAPSYDDDSAQSFSGSGESGDNSTMDDEDDIIGFFNSILEPTVYYVVVEATSASGQTVRATSNGVLIDVTPPVLSDSIRLYDVEFSLTQSSMYQGNNHTISASWGFKDSESGIVNYEWSIGTSPYGQEIQSFASVGLTTYATNVNLEGELKHNETYYVTVRATNGAGLLSEVTSSGITHLSIELNETELDNGISIQFSSIIFDAANETLFVVNDENIAVVIESRIEDVAKTSWGLTSHIDSEAISYDIFPLTDINNGIRASVDHNVFYIDNLPHSNVSDILALSDGVNPSEITGLYLEPGRLFYHIVEFCDLAHSCIQSTPRESIYLRPLDAASRSINGTDLTIVIVQNITQETNATSTHNSTLNSYHTVTITTSGGVQEGTWLFAGFLNEEDVNNVYHVDTPYISNPYLTMDQTSRELARRFSSIGGPSFFVSMFGQETLNGELTITTTFDSSVNWNDSVPRLAYWDIDNSEWREVEDTCGSQTAVNLTSYTLTVELCSTIVDGVDIQSRPSSLSRRRRNLDDEAESASGTDEEFLERPVQFIVIERGNVSLNTPPTLLFDSIITLNEDETLTYQLQFEDREEDNVLFYLTSVPTRGTATVDSATGILTYTACENCFGYESLDIYIKETNLQFGEELDAKGTLQLHIMNVNDPLSSFLFASTSHSDTSMWSSSSINVYVEANRSDPVTIARVGIYDYDGYEDDIAVYVTEADDGSSGYGVWLDVVSVPESLPVNWIGHSLENFTGYIAFVGVGVTYLPSDVSFVGTDTISVYAQQEDKITTQFLTINIEVISSLCLNNGVCGGSIDDPDCNNITNRKTNPADYNCSCSSEYSGAYCQYLTVEEPIEETESECPGIIPKMDCGGNPCDGASCPGYSEAVCMPDYCGHCKAVWYMNNQVVQCSAADETVCFQPSPPLIMIDPTLCDGMVCNCPNQPYDCPDDSVFIETRVGLCCVEYSCQCPDISCPLLMESVKEVMPHPYYRGGDYPGRCCPEYTFEDINECLEPDQNMCSHYCTNVESSYSCDCDEGVTLATDGHNCGVCTYNGLEYLYGDKVEIGCNWCTCDKDNLSGERWHCTARSCDSTCYYNGATYPVNTQLQLSSITCVCEATNTFAEWHCQSTL